MTRPKISPSSPRGKASASTRFETLVLNAETFTKATVLYTDRKLVLITLMYIVSCAVLYAHFGFSKFQSQVEKVPPAAPRYAWKVGIPTFEFGTMHVILFHLALIPLTMCRFTISKAAETFINDFLPLHEALKCHIALGYVVITLLFVTIAGFLTFFGVLCNDGNQAFCAKFTNEIMITGYVIFVVFITLGVTSYLRHKIPYKVFYIIHHLFLIAYAVTIAHTIDIVERKNGGRSQTFKWFSASLLLYVTDRAILYLNHRYGSVVIASSDSATQDKNKAITFHDDGASSSSSTSGKNMIYLKIRKPKMFHFKPGQYVYLKIPQIDRSWHPFSIASSPDSAFMEFYIERFGEKSWSGKLCILLNEDGHISLKDMFVDNSTTPAIKVQVMGPYGLSFVRKNGQYSHGLLFGSGTGVVPILSVLKQHVYKLQSLQPKAFDNSVMKSREFITEVFEATQGKRNDSILTHLFCKKKNDMTLKDDNMQTLDIVGSEEENCSISFAEDEMITNLSKVDLKQRFFRLFFKFALVLVIPPFGLLIFGLTLAWTYVSFDSYGAMVPILTYGTIAFQLSFFILALSVHEMSRILTLVDLVVLALSAVADWFWFSKNKWGNFNNEDMIFYSLLIGYMILHSWATAVYYNISGSNNLVAMSNKRNTNQLVLQKISFVWSSRSASLIRYIYPDLEDIWRSLCDSWGIEKARELCDFSIYCTDKNTQARNELIDAVKGTSLYEEGVLSFERPITSTIITNQYMSRILDDTLKASRTMFIFCGSPTLASIVKREKVLADVGILMTKQSQHQMDLIVESYGDFLKKTKRSDDHEEMKILQFAKNVEESSDIIQFQMSSHHHLKVDDLDEKTSHSC